LASAPVRNPLAGFALAILAALALSAVAGFASTFVPYLEFRLFFLGVALFGVGAFAGRKTYLGSLGFMGAYLGTFAGLYLAEQLFWVNPWMELAALGLALASGLGGFVTGKIGVSKLERAAQFAPGVRRCSSCGARVGTSAHKCWSCKATLMY
jgi:hypothetical protein